MTTHLTLGALVIVPLPIPGPTLYCDVTSKDGWWQVKHWRCTCGKTWPDSHAAITVDIPKHGKANRDHVVRIAKEHPHA